jgi:hypothetical protein
MSSESTTPSQITVTIDFAQSLSRECSREFRNNTPAYGAVAADLLTACGLLERVEREFGAQEFAAVEEEILLSRAVNDTIEKLQETLKELHTLVDYHQDGANNHRSLPSLRTTLRFLDERPCVRIIKRDLASHNEELSSLLASRSHIRSIQ